MVYLIVIRQQILSAAAALNWHGPCKQIGQLMKKTMPTFLQHPLAREITAAIVIKLLVIVAIFYAFFSGHAIQPDANAVAARLANPQQHTEQ
jgi:hypothetical protein